MLNCTVGFTKDLKNARVTGENRADPNAKVETRTDEKRNTVQKQMSMKQV